MTGTLVQWRGGTTAEHATFTGAPRELTVDTSKRTVVVHDGATSGGVPLAREDLANVVPALGRAALGLAAVATSGAYDDLTGRPSLGSAAALAVDPDPTLFAASDSRVPSQRAVKSYAETMIQTMAYKNLLINTDAGNPVNQRGHGNGAATTASGQYTLDRWRVVVGGQSLSWSESGFLAPTGGLEQVIEGMMIPRVGLYVMNWQGTATCTVNGVAVAKGGTVPLAVGTNVVVRFSGGTVALPQLEYGMVPSSYEALPHDVTLHRCLRYCWAPARTILGFTAVNPASVAGAYAAIFIPPVTLRTAPSVSLTNDGTNPARWQVAYQGTFYPPTTTPVLGLATPSLLSWALTALTAFQPHAASYGYFAGSGTVSPFIASAEL